MLFFLLTIRKAVPTVSEKITRQLDAILMLRHQRAHLTQTELAMSVLVGTFQPGVVLLMFCLKLSRGSAVDVGLHTL